MLIWDKQQGDLLEELRKTCEAGDIPDQSWGRHKARDGLRMVEKCWKIV